MTALLPAPAPVRGAGCDPMFVFQGQPGGLAVGPDGAVYVTDTDSAAIWRVQPDGLATQVVASPGSADGGDRPLYAPTGLARRADGALVVADTTAHRVCSVDPSGRVEVLAGSVSGYRDGPGGQAMFRFPRGVTIGPDGTVYVTDSGNDRIRAISPDGQVTTLAGSIFDYGDGRGAEARFRRPAAVTTDHQGWLYVADTGNNAIRRILPDGDVTTVAGIPPGGERDGSGPAAGLRWPGGIAVGADGSLWVADYGNSSVRRIDAGGRTSTVWEIPGLGWPTAVAAFGDGRVAVAGSALDADHHRTGCVMVLDGRTSPARSAAPAS